eukprot:scaffold12077_cov16-Tisochrysis_lutea.AAC.2
MEPTAKLSLIKVRRVQCALCEITAWAVTIPQSTQYCICWFQGDCKRPALSGTAGPSASGLSLADEDPGGAELLAKLAHLLACLATETMDCLKKVENGEHVFRHETACNVFPEAWDAFRQGPAHCGNRTVNHMGHQLDGHGLWCGGGRHSGGLSSSRQRNTAAGHAAACPPVCFQVLSQACLCSDHRQVYLKACVFKH